MTDERLMKIALECAAAGRGEVEPNPMVGAVLARDGRDIARGYHRRYGGPHAEVEAVQAALSRGVDLRGATLYVTLEPCCHTNKKTPPCAQMLAPLGLSRVVVAMEDPDPNVRGRGLQVLRDAGVTVTTGVCEAAARKLLRAYIKLRTQGRPWVIAKWAQTQDGYLSLPPGAGRWISDALSRDEVHRLRGRCDGILVGVGTVLADDPMLNNRSGSGRQPVRIVLDDTLRTPLTSKLVQSACEFPLIIAAASSEAGMSTDPARASREAALRDAGVEILPLPVDVEALAALLDELGRRRMTCLLVEGGLAVLRSFLAAGLADEVLTYTSPRTLGEEFAADVLSPLPRMAVDDLQAAKGTSTFELEERYLLGDDTVRRYVRG